jgi:DNA polymerase III epsilon subunit-like protein
MTDRVMIDIETLGTEPGTSIIAIGAVRFDLTDGVTDDLFASVDIESCQDHGLTIDAETLSWWLLKDGDARKQLPNGDPLPEALHALREFVGECDEVWANSPAFDCAILRSAYDAVGLETPWEYYHERDYRTIRETVDMWPDKEQGGIAHNALDDARYQAECLVAVLGGESDE